MSDREEGRVSEAFVKDGVEAGGGRLLHASRWLIQKHYRRLPERDPTHAVGRSPHSDRR